jgi:hypothetical protein
MTGEPSQATMLTPPLSPPSRSSLVPAIGCGLAFLILYALLVFPVFPPVGDASDYAYRLRAGEFVSRSSHIGYLLLAYPVASLAGAIGIPLTVALNLFAAVCMAAAIAVSQRLYAALGVCSRTATLASIILGTTGIFWYHAEFAEVQALLMLLLLSSLACYLSGRSVIAGILFAVSLLTSPAAVPTLLCFVFLGYWRGSWPMLSRFLLACGLAFLIGVAPVAQDYFFGPRGLFASMGHHPSRSVLKMVLTFGYRLVENQTVWAILLLSGTVVALRNLRHLVGFALVLWIAHAPMNLRLGHIEYGFGWMPVYVATSLLAAIGADQLTRRLFSSPRRRWLALAALVVLGGVLSYQLYVFPKRDDAVKLNEIIHEVDRTVGRAAVVTGRHAGFAYNFAITRQSNRIRESEAVPRPATPRHWRRLRAEHERIYVLVHHPPTSWLRRAMFDNSLAQRMVGAARRELMEEGGSDFERAIRRALPREWRLTSVRRWPQADLLRVDGDLR